MPTESVDIYADFIAKYPIFSNTVFGGRAAHLSAYNIALAHVSYFENIGLSWSDFKQVAIEFKTACILQNQFNQQSGSLASINASNSNTNASSQKIKQVSVEGEYTVEYESVGTLNSKQLELNDKYTGYYCDEFNNLKNLLLSDQLGDGFLYSHEYQLVKENL